MVKHNLYLMKAGVLAHELNDLINGKMRDLLPTLQISMGPNQDGKQ